MSNWEEQIKAHVKAGGLKFYLYHGSSRIDNVEELSRYDLVITSYNVVAKDSQRKTKPLFATNWFRIVLDEAHQIRNQKAAVSQHCCLLNAQRRWAVTGTPVQNRLDDLGALIKFLRVKPFDTVQGFNMYMMAPFKNADPEVLPKIRLLVDSITLRRLKDTIDLPARHDLIARLEFSEDERKLYDHYAKDAAQRVKTMTAGQDKLKGKAYMHVLRTILRLRQICAHGADLLSEEDRKFMEGMTYGDAIDLGDEDDEEAPVLQPKIAYEMLDMLQQSDSDRCEKCQKKVCKDPAAEADDMLGSKTLGYMTPCYHVICPDCFDSYMHETRSKATTDNYVNCIMCSQYVKVGTFKIDQKELDDYYAELQRIRDDPHRAKTMGKYTGPHTKVCALLESLRKDREWSQEHPDEPPIKR